MVNKAQENVINYYIPTSIETIQKMHRYSLLMLRNIRKTQLEIDSFDFIEKLGLKSEAQKKLVIQKKEYESLIIKIHKAWKEIN